MEYKLYFNRYGDRYWGTTSYGTLDFGDIPGIELIKEYNANARLKSDNSLIGSTKVCEYTVSQPPLWAPAANGNGVLGKFTLYTLSL